MKTAFAMVAFTMSAVVYAAGPAGISINGSANGAAAEQGMPVILSFTSAAAIPAPPDTLEASGGPGGSRATLKYRPNASGESTFGAKLVTRTDVWTLDPAQTDALAPGTYSVTLPGGEQARFSIGRRDSASDSAAARSERLLLLSAWAEIDGDNGRALELATQLVADQPNSVAAKLRLSDLLAEQGQLGDALRLLDEAEVDATRGKRLPHPPVAIRARQAQILDQMTAPLEQPNQK